MKGKHFYFVGIGGVGMSGLARILISRGVKVSGSDLNEEAVKPLIDLGAKVFIGHDEKNISGAEVLIVSAAIDAKNPELLAAKKAGINILKRSELLNILMLEKKGIAIAGTHGKTTTSTMLAMVLEEAGMDPAFSIGGDVRPIGANAKDGKGDYFIAETCEYDRAFLDMHPYAGIITNIEADHLDIYKDLDDIKSAFKQYVSQFDEEGFLVVSKDDVNIPGVIEDFGGNIITFGINSADADFSAKEIRVEENLTFFTAYKHNQKIAVFSLKIPGLHNVMNALAVIAVSFKLEVKIGAIRKALSEFEGAIRRFEIKGEKDGVLVIDDYGHHPTEIKTTLQGLRSIYKDLNRTVWAVFQAHQYSRTKLLLDDFGNSFSNADKVIVTEIYRARDTEEDVKSVSGEMLAEKINQSGKEEKAIYIKDFSDVAKYLNENTKKGDIVITIGAGPINKVGEEFLKVT